ncbi:MAG: mandelate racemase/muconate lactonizing enzyme family protein [Opitutales bacterium]|nr:mandelate racemase/muconate lactonizing enzyme family protein [Opitutales bacterium]
MFFSLVKIESIEAFVLESPLKRAFYFSQWEYQTRRICLVKITAGGLVGWGEAYGPADMALEGIRFFAPYLLGRDALETETLWQLMYRRSLDYARRGVMMASLSAIDVALWDLKGKFHGLPISTLLGGKKRDYVEPYVTGMYFRESDQMESDIVQEAIEYTCRGFKALKMKVGLGVSRDLPLVRSVRDAVGEDIEIMIDSNHAFSLSESIRVCDELNSERIRWFEEPLSPEHYGLYTQLRKKVRTPIAAGECEYLRSGFLQLFQNECVDIAQPDICAAGGVTECKKIADLASVFGVEFVPHTWGTNINLCTAAQLLATVDDLPGRMFPAPLMLEWDQTENPIRDEVTVTNLNFSEGQLAIPDAPGHGVQIDEEALRAFLVKSF